MPAHQPRISGKSEPQLDVVHQMPFLQHLQGVIWPVNALFPATVCEEASWHLVQPAVRIHDQEHSRRQLIGRHNIRRSTVQTQWRGYPRVCESLGIPQWRFWHARGCSQPGPWSSGFLDSPAEAKLRDQGFCRFPPLILNRCVFDLPPPDSLNRPWVKVLGVSGSGLREIFSSFNGNFQAKSTYHTTYRTSLESSH